MACQQTRYYSNELEHVYLVGEATDDSDGVIIHGIFDKESHASEVATKRQKVSEEGKYCMFVAEFVKGKVLDEEPKRGDCERVFFPIPSPDQKEF